ncbi:hypothetical protein JYQ62_09030 [Nostoc sp. UHCC 0702]|nr:hypothetical protein JYQ62_09030 [Nostoc sp. UHCC 0702]
MEQVGSLGIGNGSRGAFKAGEQQRKFYLVSLSPQFSLWKTLLYQTRHYCNVD